MTANANRIRELRKQHGLSQDQVAVELKVSRPTYIAIEQGEKELTLSQLKSLVALYGIRPEEIAGDLIAGNPSDSAMPKFKQIILNALHFGGDTGDGKITKTKLAKLVYLADFAWFYYHDQAMSGLSYRCIQRGPVPDDYFRAIDDLFDEGLITIQQSGAAFMIAANEAPSRSSLKDEEVKLIQKIAKKWKDKPTSDIVEFTHNQNPWKSTEQGRTVSYELIKKELVANLY